MQNRVRETLEFQGRHHRWLAEQLGVDKSYLSKVLQEERPMPADWPDRIAFLLQVPRSLLFFVSSSTDVDKSPTPVEPR